MIYSVTHTIKKNIYNNVRLRYKLTVSVNTELNQGLALSIYSPWGRCHQKTTHCGMSSAYHILIMAIQYMSDDEPEVMLIKGMIFIEDGTKPFPDGSSVWTESLPKNK